MEVAPEAMPITNTLRVERITALAMAGLATNTSLASAGRSTMIDLPIPRSTFRAETRSCPVASMRRTEALGSEAPATAGWENAPAETSETRSAAAIRRRGEELSEDEGNAMERLWNGCEEGEVGADMFSACPRWRTRRTGSR